MRKWRVHEIEFHCHSPQFLISNKGVMKCQLAVNLNGCLKGNDYLYEKGEQPPRKEEGQMGSAVW